MAIGLSLPKPRSKRSIDMKLTTLCASLVGLAGIAAIPAATDIQFKPAESTTLNKEYKVSLDFALDDLVMTMNGEEMDPAMMGLDLDEMSAQVSMALSFSDEFVGMKGSKPTELKRTFKSGTAEYETGTGESDTENMSDFEGEVVVFKWNEEKGGYDLTDGDGEEVKEEMQIMSEDTDLKVFLPKSSVEEGDTWVVKGRDLIRVMVPGVNLDKAMEMADAEAANEGDVPFTPSDMMAFLDEMGEIECTFKGMREVEGVSLQVIALKPAIEKTIDLTDMLATAIEEMGQGAEIDISAEVTLEGAGEGELLWDAAAGHFRSYKMEMELTTLITGEGGAEGMSGAMEVEATTTVVYDFQIN